MLLSAGVYQHGDQPLVVAGRSLSLYPPHNLITIAYVLLFLRLAPWWWRTGRQRVRQLDGRLRQVILWHLCPLAVWFLLPKHLSYFLWYLSPADCGPGQGMDLAAGVRDYSNWLTHDYHLNPVCALVAVGLCVAGLLAWRCLRRGGQVVLVLTVLAAVLTVTHPNHKSRNLHSWIAAIWVGAGAGAASLIYGRATAGWPRLRPWLAGAVVTGLAWMQYPALTASGHAPEGGPHPDHPSMLDATDGYLADLDGACRTLILTAAPVKPLTQWTFLQRFGDFKRLEERWYGFGEAGADNRRGFVRWLQTTDCDTLVYFEALRPPESWPDTGPECRPHAELSDVLRTQRVFHLVKQWDVPHYFCRVQVWKRDSEALTLLSDAPRWPSPGAVPLPAPGSPDSIPAIARLDN